MSRRASQDHLLLQQYASDQESERLYRRWIGDLLRAASDDLLPESWDRLMLDIARIRGTYDGQRAQ